MANLKIKKNPQLTKSHNGKIGVTNSSSTQHDLATRQSASSISPDSLMQGTSPYTASEASEARIDFLRGASSLDVDKPAFAQVQAPNSRQDYVARRFQLWDGPSDTNGEVNATYVELGAISRLPLGLQVAFRIKMLTIFALQLLLVGALVGACAYLPQVTDQLKSGFQGQIAYLIGAAVGVVVLLVLLYFIRALFPLNWIVLLLFSAAQALLFAVLGIKFDTNLGFFNCAATLSCILIMLLLSGVRSVPDEEPKLLSPIISGFIAYVVVALVSCVLFGKYGREFITAEGFGASLAFQLVLILWFAVDAASMYRVMSPDEYMHGVIYFYTDMVLLVVMAAVAVGVVTLLAFCCGDDGACSSCDCNGGASSGGGSGANSSSSSGGGGTSNCCATTCTWTDCCFWLYRLCIECTLNLVDCFDCNRWECCECHRNNKKHQQQQPLHNDDQEEHMPGLVLYGPSWDELRKEPSVVDVSVKDLKMQRI